MHIKHKILITAPTSGTALHTESCYSALHLSDGVRYKHRCTHYSPHYNVTCSLQARYEPRRYSLSYRHFCLAVSDEVWLWRHVASGVQLLFCDAEFLVAVALPES